MNDKVFHGAVEKLRSPVRVERLQIERVLNYSCCALEIETVLDVGTGTGLFAEAFTNRGYSVCGVDCNEEFLKIAREHVSSAKFQKAPAESLPFDSASFDLVFMGHILHEADDPALAIREAHRVSRKRLAILEWPYLEQESGPPIDHRIQEDTIRTLAFEAGFTCCDSIQLREMRLYILDK